MNSLQQTPVNRKTHPDQLFDMIYSIQNIRHLALLSLTPPDFLELYSHNFVVNNTSTS